MVSKEYIETKLVNYTNASMSDVEVKNSRYHYQLFFDESIGFDWIEAQINKAAGKVGKPLELYKFGPANSYTRVDVRELQRREGIDDDQRGLDSFEKE